MNIKTHHNYIKLAVILALFIITFTVYWQTRNHDFLVYDDNVYITVNQYVQYGFNFKSIKWAFTTTVSGNWHPLTWLSHILDYQFYGLNPSGHHLTNLLIHIMNSVLLFLLFNRTTRALWQSSFIAALFALHPLHIESVAWVAERKDVLSTFFFLLTLWTYVYYVRRRDSWKYTLILIFFVLGLMAKPMLVSLPFILLLLDYWPLGRIKIPDKHNTEYNSLPNIALRYPPIVRIILEKTPFLILSLIFSFIAFFAQKSAGAVAPLELLPFKLRAMNAPISYLKYIWKMVLPYNLSVFYPYSFSSLTLWSTIGAVFLLLFISIIAIIYARKFKYIIVGWFWYLGTLVPVIGIIQVGNQAMADRYTYIPLIGLFIIITWGIPDLLRKLRYLKIMLALSSAIILIFLSIETYAQLRNWRNSITLFEHAIKVTDYNYVAYDNLGYVYATQEKFEEAKAYLLKTIAFWPDNPNAHNILGYCLYRQGKYLEASKHYSEALRIRPHYADAHNNFGILLFDSGRVDEAITHYHAAIAILPREDYFNNLGLALLSKGKFEDAIKSYLHALRLNPRFEAAKDNLRQALEKKLNDVNKSADMHK